MLALTFSRLFKASGLAPEVAYFLAFLALFPYKTGCLFEKEHIVSSNDVFLKKNVCFTF